MASLCASAALRFDCSAETALATSVLFLVPGVPLINGVIDIVEGHILIGCSRLINALLLIICIAIGLSATLLMAVSRRIISAFATYSRSIREIPGRAVSYFNRSSGT